MNIVNPADWLAWRSKGLGASDAAASCGASRYKSRYKLWLEKTGQSVAQSTNERMQWGLRLETAIAEAYTERTGIRGLEHQIRCEHPQYPWMRATLDARVEDRLVEFKTVGLETGRELGDDGDSDSLPTEWILQVQHQLAVTNLHLCDVAVFLGHLLELRVYPVERNDQLISSLVETESEFWSSVEQGIQPEPESLEDYLDLAKLIRAHEKRITITDPEVGITAYHYADYNQQIKKYTELRDHEKMKLLSAIAGHEYGDLPDGRVIRAQVIEIPERTQNVKAHTQLRLTVREPRGSDK